MKFLNHNLFTGDITVSGITTLNTATGVTRTTSDNSTHLATTAFVKNQGYLTTETDTLDSVTDRGSVTTNSIGVGTVNIIGTTAGAELLTVDGTFGRLFTVTDDLSDSLFSVNTVAGLPVIEVFADNTINLGAFSNSIVIDSSSNIVIPGTITASGYNSTNWNTAYNDRIVSAAVTGTTTKTLTLTQTDGGTISTSWTDINTDTDGYISNVSLVGSTLSFTSVGSAFSGIVDLSTLTPTVRTVYEIVKNASGAIIYKGTPLAVVPGQTSGNVSDVVPADAADPTKMPAVFIANQNIADEAEGEAVLFGNLTGVDTSLYQSGTTVYVAPGGGWTATKPVWPNKIQNLGVITKQHATNGAGIVTGVGRANDLPNLTAGKIWVGSANYPIESTTVHVDEANGRVGIGTTSPNEKLVISNNGAAGFEFQPASGRFYRYNRSTTAYAGIYSEASEFTWSIGTTERLRINSSGNVGVGVTSPANKLIAASNASATSENSYAIAAAAASDPAYKTVIGYDFTNDVGLIAAVRTGIGWRNISIPQGNLGIGTITPTQKLQVTGNVRVTGAYYDSNNQAGTTGQVLTSTGSGTDWKSLSEITGVDGTGTANYVTKWSDADTITNSIIYDNGTNVGIGTAGPGAKLHVSGSTYIRNDNSTNQLTIDNDSVGSNAAPQYSDVLFGGYSSTLRARIRGIDRASNLSRGGIIFQASPEGTTLVDRLFLDGNGESYFYNNSAEVMRITTAGNVGIGTTSPGFKLDVAGDINTSNGVYRIGGSTILSGTTSVAVGSSGATGTVALRTTSGDGLVLNGGNVGIGTTAPQSLLHLSGTNTNLSIQGANAANGTQGIQFLHTATSACGYIGSITTPGGGTGDLVFSVGTPANGQIMRITAAGNVGISTTTPAEKLHVVGNIRIDGSSTAAILETGDKTANEGGVIFETYDVGTTYGAFVDYVIYDTTRDNMRTGTLRAVWNTGQAVYTDVSTVDIGDTNNVVLYADIDGTNVNLIVNGPTSFTIKYNLKLIK